jgi:hypothetical protein
MTVCRVMIGCSFAIFPPYFGCVDRAIYRYSCSIRTRALDFAGFHGLRPNELFFVRERLNNPTVRTSGRDRCRQFATVRPDRYPH